ncbi:MAG TPA: AMP-binding protein [Hydrogenophaga sp.]
MSDFFDALETRTPAEREAAQMAALSTQVAHAQSHSAAFAAILQGVNPNAINSREALAGLPVTRKSELLDLQMTSRAQQGDAFGGFSALVRGPAMSRIFASPGPIYEPEGANPDYWRTGRALYAAGFRQGELVHNAFSYHMTPGAFILESGAHAVGCTVFPAGTGQTEQQLDAIRDLRPNAYTGTPSFLRILLEKAAQSQVDISCIKKASVGGEACPPSLTAWFKEQGVDVYQTYATADLGLVAYETTARDGLVVEESVIVEIVRPGTGDPVAEGEVGELVVTTLNPAYPLIRFGTGDLSAILPGHCPSGRTAPRIKGWMGRADQTTKVKGMFVHPGQIAEVARRFPAVQKARLVISGEMANDQMHLQVEVAQAPADLSEQLESTLREVTKLRGTIQLMEPGSLPNDGKVIEDARSYK